MITGADKARENRLRRLAERGGAFLSRARRRDRTAWDYGTYWLIPEPEHPLWIDADEDDLEPVLFHSLDEVEQFLLGKRWAQERVEQRAMHAGLTIERATINGTSARTIWLSSPEDLRWGPFYSFDEVENYLRAAPEQRPPREWRRTSFAG